MGFAANGELIPSGGGDNIPLIRDKLSVGRRESCDICLRFPNVSGMHAELSFREGYWYVRDCNSTNGIKVNGTRVLEKLLYPKDRVTIGKRDYVINYDLPADHRVHTIIALGQPGDPATLNDRLRPREVPSGRMPLSDIAGHGAFPKA